MNPLRKLTPLAAACGLALLAAGSVSAQAAQPAQPSAPPPAQGRGQMLDQMQHRRAEKLRTLHDALSIRPDQEGAWQAFAASMTPMHPQPPMGPGPQGAQMTTPERLDRMDARMREHLADFERHIAAVKALYRVLTPAQQRTFDALMKMHMRHMHGRRGHGGMGHGGMGYGGMDMGGPMGGEH